MSREHLHPPGAREQSTCAVLLLGPAHALLEPRLECLRGLVGFDRATIRLFGLSDRSLLEFLERGLPTHGNGSEEVRNWLVAHGAAGGRGFELVDYLPVPTVIVGCGFASWKINGVR